MKKTYENPMLQIVSINKHDIIVTSTTAPVSEEQQANEDALAPGMRSLFDGGWDVY